MTAETTKQVRQYLAKHRRKQELEHEISRLKEEMKALQENILKHFQRTGHQNQRIEGGVVHLRRDLYANTLPGPDGTHALTMQALRNAGLEQMAETRVNAQELRAYLRELEARDQEVPPELEPHLKVSEVFRVRARG